MQAFLPVCVCVSLYFVPMLQHCEETDLPRCAISDAQKDPLFLPQFRTVQENNAAILQAC